VRKSALLHAALDRFLHLRRKKDGVRFRAHERNSSADEHGDGEHIESIPHEEKGRQGVQCQAKENRKRSGSKVE
jgi:hypothetical protein